MDNKTCKSCGEGSIIEETEDGRTFFVCTDCGTLDNETEELTSEQQFKGTTITDGGFSGLKTHSKQYYNKQTGFEKWLSNGKSLIVRVGTQVKVSKSMIEGAQGLFEHVFSDLYRRKTDTKQAMCIACLFVEIRNSGGAIRLIELCNCLNETNLLSKCGKAVKILKTIHNVQIRAPSVSAQVEHILRGVGIDPGTIDLTKQVMELLDAAFLLEGRSINVSMICAGFFAWQSRTVGNQSSKSFKKYCDKFGFKDSSLVCERKQEISKFLVSLAKEIPWVKMSKKPVTCASQHIGDIIKHKSYLLVKAKETKKEVIRVKLENDTEHVKNIDPAVEIDNPHQVDSNHDITLVDQRASRKRKYMEKQIDEPAIVFRNCPKLVKGRHGRIVHDAEQCVRDSAIKVASLMRENGTDGNDDSEIDLGSDDDTDMYILKPEEALQRKEVLKKLKSI